MDTQQYKVWDLIYTNTNIWRRGLPISEYYPHGYEIEGIETTIKDKWTITYYHLKYPWYVFWNWYKVTQVFKTKDEYYKALSDMMFNWNADTDKISDYFKNTFVFHLMRIIIIFTVIMFFYTSINK